MQEPPRRPYSTVTGTFERPVDLFRCDVDALETTLWLVVLASITLDVYTTYLGLTAGLTEGNPVMRWAIEGYGFAALGLAKLAVLAGAGIVRELRPRYGPTIALGLAIPWVLTVAINVVVLSSL